MKLLVFILSLSFAFQLNAQVNKEVGKEGRPRYNRKEEVVYDGKRYRKYNNYLTAGGGFASASNRKDVQKAVGIDFQFHVRRQQFQMGVMMAGDAFLSNNHVQAHVGYGLRRERNTSNFAIFAGPTYFTGVEGTPGITLPQFYDGFGAYLSAQAITKFTYDIGFGVELFGELNYKQSMGGIKFIFFFSGAYRGTKASYSPNPNFDKK